MGATVQLKSAMLVEDEERWRQNVFDFPSVAELLYFRKQGHFRHAMNKRYSRHA
jgi:hypothetical protein